MNSKARICVPTLLFTCLALVLTTGMDCQGNLPPGFSDANVALGGAMYDKWWSVTGDTAPTTDHPLWASRPDTTTNTRTGADTWRCKECHGWDYKGVAGAYSTGSHRTGIAGIFGTTMDALAIFDLLKDDSTTTTNGHGFGTAGLSDAEILNLTRFVLEGQIDTDTIIDSNGMFTGNATTGATLYSNGIGTGVACSVCHGTDGLTPPPGAAAGYDAFVGAVADANAWEFQHKVRYGQPGTTMPASDSTGGTTQDVSDLGAHSQTLPQS